MKFYQCRLEKWVDNSLISTVTFLPEKYSKVGECVSLKNGEIWDDGWTVKDVWSSIDDPKLVDSHNAIKKHRKETGDALPK